MEGRLVIEAASTWAGPLAAMLPGDHGASVIKIEHPLGDVGRRIPPMLRDIDPPTFIHARYGQSQQAQRLA